MLKRITGEEFDEALATYQVSAFRLEQQPAYQVDYEAGHLAAWLAGDPIPPDEIPGFPEWTARIREQTAAGRIMTRVRVHDIPPTDYQRWLRWVDPYNVEAGEILHYLPRPEAVAAGIVASQGDFWLLDSTRLIVMRYDSIGTPIEKTLTDAPEALAEAIRVRNQAMQISTPDH
jgi:hypothetical protein